MLAGLWSALRKSSTRPPRQALPLNRRPCLEALEDRNLLSGGPGVSGATVGGPASSPVAVLNQGGGPGGGSGGPVISGPGYPLAPASGPARPDPGILSQPPAGVVLVPISGTPGGPGPTVAVVPVCTGSPASEMAG